MRQRLHQKFLRYCEVERRLSPHTVVAYRSDFLQFLEVLRAQSRWGLVSQDVLGTFSVANVRLYQYAMVEDGASRATMQRRLVSRQIVLSLKSFHSRPLP